MAVRASSLASQLPQGAVGLVGLGLAEDDDSAGEFGAFDAVGVADQQGDAGELV